MNWLIHPIETLKSWGVEKFVVGTVNKTIAAKRESIDAARRLVRKYINKLENLIAFYKAIDAALDDGLVDKSEAKYLVAKGKGLALELTK